MVICAFDILANKWRIFHRPLDITPQFCSNIVKVCAYCTVTFTETMGFIQSMKVTSKAFKLKGHTETPKESMWEIMSPSILQYNKVWFGIWHTLKKYLPVLTTARKYQLSVGVNFLCTVKHLCILQQINVNLFIWINDIKNNTFTFSCFSGPSSWLHSETTASHTSPHSLSFRPLLLYSVTEQLYRAGCLCFRNHNFTVIQLFEHHSGSEFFVLGSHYPKEMALDGIRFIGRKGDNSQCACTYLFLCVLFIQAFVKRQLCHPWKLTYCNFFISMIK